VSEPLRESDLAGDPVEQFRRWFDEARASGALQPEAMTPATADGRPSARMVLLKSWGAEGFGFHTSYGSRKARELDENARAALVVYWPELGRQVRVEGTVEKVTRDESEAYFRTRPRGSRIAALASEQSSVLGSREELEKRYAEVERQYEGTDEIPLPERWGGYRVRPESIEFWQHREHRLHDRLRYARAREGWVVERLAP
jgi:pyridoxamine 5'-phosphate oxidase